MSEEIQLPNETPAEIPAKAISVSGHKIDKRTKGNLSKAELTGRNLKIITEYAENGLTYVELGVKYNLSEDNIFHILQKYAHLYSPQVSRNKLKRMALLNRKHKQNEQDTAKLDTLDVIKELRAEYEPKQTQNLTIIDKQLTINTADLDSLPLSDKLERVRRALADGMAN